MQIYLLRHAMAENGRAGTPDSDRRLTAEGRGQLTQVLKLAGDAGASPDLVLASPYQRAMETARMAAAAFGYSREIQVENALTPDRDPETVWTAIRMHPDARRLLVVSHEPLISATLGYLVGCLDLRVEFGTATIARVDVNGFGPAPRGVLRWLIAPAMAGAR